MKSRRNFIIKTTLGTGAVLTGAKLFGSSKINASPQSALIFDAMGEVREVYTTKLVKEMLASGLNAITVTLCDPKTFEQNAVDTALEGINHYNKFLGARPDLFMKATKLSDIDRARQEGKLAVFYLFQNSSQFGRDLSNVDLFYDLGVRSSQITYNYQNWAGAGCKERTGAGLTLFGMELVAKMNSKGMLIDLSHSNTATMTDTIKASKDPVIISHTTCLSLFDNERNTSDENMKLLADKGGVVGMCQMRPFISKEKKGAYQKYINHIMHAIKIAGEDHVCIGSDRDHRRIVMTAEYIAELEAEEGANFNADHWPLYMEELNGPKRMETIWNSLKERKLTESVIEKIMGKNVYRIYQEVIG